MVSASVRPAPPGQTEFQNKSGCGAARNGQRPRPPVMEHLLIKHSLSGSLSFSLLDFSRNCTDITSKGLPDSEEERGEPP